MTDITPAIQEKIESAFQRNLSNNKEITRLQKLLEAGKAGWDEADKYAVEVGQSLGKALYSVAGEYLPDGKIYYNIASRVIPPSLKSLYEDVSEYARVVQKGINERAKTSLNAVVPEYSAYREKELVDYVSDAESYDGIKTELQKRTTTFSQQVVTDTMQENAKLHNAVGLKALVTRIYDEVGVHNRKDKCQWCLERCGTDVPYSEANAKGMFQRHPGCGCRIFYTTEKGTQVQTDWESNQWTAPVQSGIISMRREEELTPLLETLSNEQFAELFQENPAIFRIYSPITLKRELENRGFDVKPLSRGKLQGRVFEEGGGYIVRYRGDGAIEYHPGKGSRHGGRYYRLSDAAHGKRWFDTDGREIDVQKTDALSRRVYK